MGRTRHMFTCVLILGIIWCFVNNIQGSEGRVLADSRTEGEIVEDGAEQGIYKNWKEDGISLGHTNHMESDANIKIKIKRKRKKLKIKIKHKDFDEDKVAHVVQRQMSTTAKKWTFPIQFTLDSSLSEKLKRLVLEAVSEWQNQTCITFTKVTKPTGPHINFRKETFEKSCGSSLVGKQPYVNNVNIGCFVVGVIIHEIGHTLGLWHEQSRPDRDDWVNVNYQNILNGHQRNFQKTSWDAVTSHGVPFDYSSIMQYPSMAFKKSSDGGQTLTPTYDRKLVTVMGQRGKLSFWDAKLVNLHYCKDKCQTKLQCKNDGYTDPNDCTKCRCPEGWAGQLCDQVQTQAVCGSAHLKASKSRQILSSPGFPNYYSQGNDCAWLITSPPNTMIFVDFVGEFKLTCSRLCIDDYVEIRYLDKALTGPRYCCDKRPVSTFNSYGSSMLIVFRANAKTNISNRGFSLSYRYATCGGCNSEQSWNVPCYHSLKTECQATYTEPCGPGLSFTCDRYRKNTCLKTRQTCCDNYKFIWGVCKYTGCGGCQNKLIPSQKPCQDSKTLKPKQSLWECIINNWSWSNCQQNTQAKQICCSGFALKDGQCTKS